MPSIATPPDETQAGDEGFAPPAGQEGPPEESSVEAGDGSIDDIVKQVEHRTWRFSGEFKFDVPGGESVEEIFEREYTQKPLSYMAMLEFTGLIGRKIAQAMEGEGGVSIDGLFGGNGVVPLAQLTRSDFSSADALVSGIAKLASYVPDIIDECQCIWLRVPRNDRPFVSEIWNRPVDEGGLSIQDGTEMLELFLEQNYDEVERFFVERLPHLLKRTQEMREAKKKGTLGAQRSDKQQSKRSRRTPPSTPKQ